MSAIYFYCKHLDEQRNTFIALARAVLAQLLNQNKDLVSYLYDKYVESGSISLVSAQLSRELLDTALKSLTKVYIIIDGLDECQRNERKSILSFFTSIIESTQPGFLRGLFVSQDEDDIRQSLQRASLVRLTEDDNRQDIQIFAGWWAERIRQKFDLSQEHGWYIRNVVCDGAEGGYNLPGCSREYADQARNVSICEAGPHESLWSDNPRSAVRGASAREIPPWP